jgi:putative flippase GtrA
MKIPKNQIEIASFFDIVGSQKIRYIIVGVWNTFFGYLIGLVIYYWLQGRIHTLIVVGTAYIVSITMAFVTHKLFVFRTRGRWFSEYIRSYVVYGASGVFGIVALWGLVDGMEIPFWIAQFFVLFITIIISYLGHLRFTFSR